MAVNLHGVSRHLHNAGLHLARHEPPKDEVVELVVAPRRPYGKLQHARVNQTPQLLHVDRPRGPNGLMRPLSRLAPGPRPKRLLAEPLGDVLPGDGYACGGHPRAVGAVVRYQPAFEKVLRKPHGGIRREAQLIHRVSQQLVRGVGRRRVHRPLHPLKQLYGHPLLLTQNLQHLPRQLEPQIQVVQLEVHVVHPVSERLLVGLHHPPQHRGLDPPRREVGVLVPTLQDLAEAEAQPPILHPPHDLAHNQRVVHRPRAG